MDCELQYCLMGKGARGSGFSQLGKPSPLHCTANIPRSVRASPIIQILG